MLRRSSTEECEKIQIASTVDGSKRENPFSVDCRRKCLERDSPSTINEAARLSSTRGLVDC